MSVQLAPADTMIRQDAFERRPANSRGMADHGWLRSAHSFSFASYYDADRMAFEGLRVINDDWIAPGGGFPTHPHQDFEIFSYVLSGAISHKDSMGNGSTVSAGGIQYMTAGRGVRHSEFNPSDDVPMELLQIWLMPKVRGAEPRYEVLELAAEDKAGRLVQFIAEDATPRTIHTLAAASVYAGTFDGDERAHFTVKQGRSAYIHIAKGQVNVNGLALERGDALSTRMDGDILISQGNNAEVLVFDLRSLPETTSIAS